MLLKRLASPFLPFFALSLLLGVFAESCKDGSIECEGAAFPAASLAGTWRVVHGSDGIAEMEVDYQYAFKAADVVKRDPDGNDLEAYTFTLEGSTLVLANQNTDMEFPYCVALTGDTLSMTQNQLNHAYKLVKVGAAQTDEETTAEPASMQDTATSAPAA